MQIIVQCIFCHKPYAILGMFTKHVNTVSMWRLCQKPVVGWLRTSKLRRITKEVN